MFEVQLAEVDGILEVTGATPVEIAAEVRPKARTVTIVDTSRLKSAPAAPAAATVDPANVTSATDDPETGNAAGGRTSGTGSDDALLLEIELAEVELT